MRINCFKIILSLITASCTLVIGCSSETYDSGATFNSPLAATLDESDSSYHLPGKSSTDTFTATRVEALQSPKQLTSLIASPANSVSVKQARNSRKHSLMGNSATADSERYQAYGVSGSMNDADKLGLLKSSIMLMASRLTERDRVAIVVYAGACGVVLEPTPGNQSEIIAQALKSLSAGGSTNGEQGIRLAYQLAREHFQADGLNRVILATDGDFNVGVSDVEKLKTMVSEQRQSGVALTTLGFGGGNYNDHMMEQLADIGNGAYAYIDSLNEARKVLIEELDATLMTIASDAKIQIEFNPEIVSEYRLIGYVNRRLQNVDFNNDKVDAGEIGAGHSVTALYEISMVGQGGDWNTKLRYTPASGSEKGAGGQAQEKAADSSISNEVAHLRLRYKSPVSLSNAGSEEASSKLIAFAIADKDLKKPVQASDNFRFAAAVAAFGQRLRNNTYFGDFDFDDIALLAAEARGKDIFGYRAEFIKLVELAGELAKVHAKMSGYKRQG